MNLSEINWDPNQAGTWPLLVKAAIISVICVLVFGAGVYYDTLDQLAALDVSEKKELELKRSFEEKQKKAINLPDYQDQLAQIEAQLGEMIRQMPTKEEVASLLIDISQTGLASGLEFRLFKPGDPVRKDFYSELPISIEVIGKYEELGLFVSGLASLPRIVTVHDVSIAPDGANVKWATKQAKEVKGVKDAKGLKDAKGVKDVKEGKMMMIATVKTYNEGGDEAASAESSGDKVKKKRGDKGKEKGDKGKEKGHGHGAAE
jgi:type IV pilus assembly protein PilO